MEPEFCLGWTREGHLVDGLLIKLIRRECPTYDFAWYAKQANWIVTQVEIIADPISAAFRTPFHNTDFLSFGNTLSSAMQGRGGAFRSTWVSRDRRVRLSAKVGVDGNACRVAFLLTKRDSWHPVNRKFRAEFRRPEVTAILNGVEQIRKAFPVISILKQNHVTTGQRRPRMLRLLHALRLPLRWRMPPPSKELLMEYDGQCIARLTDPQFAEMFWTSYKFTMLTQDPVVLEMLDSEKFRRGFHDAEINYRFIDSGKIADTFPAASGIVDGRLWLRG
jgi:hypothetical protein